MKLRTLSTIPSLVGVVRDTWQNGMRAVYPVKSSWGMDTQDTILMKSCPEGQHIIHLAINWAEALKQGIVVSCAEIDYLQEEIRVLKP